MVAFEEEWAHFKRQASANAGMNLASADGPAGWETKGQGRLKSKKTAWQTAANSVGSLKSDIKKALTRLEHEQKGLEAGTDTGDGVHSAAAERELYHSWKRYLDDVSGRCTALQDLLEKAGDSFYKNDEATRDAFSGLTGHYKDTGPVGGENQRR
ncbi:hypothetical protein [Streptomyces sp. S465]|uniref:hypothetical protein n=1 Tax=Streptomyces sp. S465 TaxID=2979468 RepID=UPI0022A8816D|nr:hypothetical protein [Streptomyces sp. S465]WAP58657.1 hypothetical protein N6H00_28905 [Streptomyces sp. S465]